MNEEPLVTSVPESRMDSVTIKYAVIVIAILVIVVASYVLGNLRNRKDAQNVPNAGVGVIETKETDHNGEIPPNFPTSTLLGASSTSIVQSVSKETGSRLQQDVVIQSPKTLKENYTLYKNLLLEEGWSILTDKKEDKDAVLVGMKNELQVNIIIIGRSTTSTSTIRSSVIVSTVNQNKK